MTKEEYQEYLEEIERQIQEEHQRSVRITWLYIGLGFLVGLLLFGAMLAKAEAFSWDYTQCTDFTKCGLATQFNLKADKGCIGTFTTVATVPANIQTANDPNQYNQGDLICYVVTAANQQGESTPSNVVRFQVPVLVPLPASGLH